MGITLIIFIVWGTFLALWTAPTIKVTVLALVLFVVYDINLGMNQINEENKIAYENMTPHEKYEAYHK